MSGDVHPLFQKTGGILLVFAVGLSIPYTTPRLAAFRIWGAPEETSEATSHAATKPHMESGEQALAASENRATVTNALPPSQGELPSRYADFMKDVAIEDPTGRALSSFAQSLARTKNKDPRAITRILHYGDSVIASDYISGTMRRRLQARFGDGGHGFILIANPWQWYFHNDVVHWASEGWNASKLSGPVAPDGRYGLGGVSFLTYGGATATFGTAAKGEFGRKTSRFDVFYAEDPRGGELELSVKGGERTRISTRGEAGTSRVHSVPVEDGGHELTLRALGKVRAFGVALEREGPGVTVDALGAHAAMVAYWKQMGEAHWREQFALRKPALILVQYGTNESDLWKVDREEYEQTLTEVLRKIRAAAQGASILVAAPLDRAEMSGGKLRTKKVIVDLVRIQREVALREGLAFYNTFEAMGGEGSMAKWASATPALGGGDLTHPTPLGAELLGWAFSDALVRAAERTDP